MLTASDTVLFQGDSITDAGRNRDLIEPGHNNHPAAYGHGYVGHAAATLLARHPGITVHNRGVAGDRVTYLAERWEHDALNLQPTLICILIGINDTWHGTAKGTPDNGTTLEQYDTVFRALLDQTREKLPGVKLVIGEPFTLQSGAVLELPFHPEIDERRALAKKIAQDYDAVWVPFQEMFDDLSTQTEPRYWAGDGVHPTAAGHAKMAELWLEKVCGS